MNTLLRHKEISEKNRVGRAFTLIEIVIILALLGMFASVGLWGGLGEYRRALARADSSTILHATLRARAESMAGICETTPCAAPAAHGVWITSQAVTLFEGSSYTARTTAFDTVFPLSGLAQITMSSENDAGEGIGSSSDEVQILFVADSGMPESAANLTIADPYQSTHILMVNTEGQILMQSLTLTP